MDCGANDLRFTPVESLLGGLLIGEAAGVVLLCYGRVLGFSGIFAGTVRSVPRPAPALLGGLAPAARSRARRCAASRRARSPRPRPRTRSRACSSARARTAAAAAARSRSRRSARVAALARRDVRLHRRGRRGRARRAAFRRLAERRLRANRRVPRRAAAWPDARRLLAVVAAAAVAPLGAIAAARPRARPGGRRWRGSAAIAGVDVAAGGRGRGLAWAARAAGGGARLPRVSRAWDPLAA